MTDGYWVTVRREIAAFAEELFDAWLDGQSLGTWFRPAGVRETRAETDPRWAGRSASSWSMTGPPFAPAPTARSPSSPPGVHLVFARHPVPGHDCDGDVPTMVDGDGRRDPSDRTSGRAS